VNVLDPDELRARVAALSVWSQNGERAPHKPLLLLLALGHFASGQRDLPFSVVEPALADLLRAFGPPRRPQPELPFWWLRSDGLWELSGTGSLTMRKGSNAPTVTSLRKEDPIGRLPDEVRATLRAHPALTIELARTILAAHFPASLHGEILGAVGLNADAVPTAPRRRRDPRFRDDVLRAYGYRCAVCGFEVRVGPALVGVDAAHVMWHQAGGPDEIPNGLALCALHHRLLDRGAFTLASSGSHETVVEVAETAHGGEGFERWLLDYHGRPIARPVSVSYRVAEPSVAWHRREVFRGPARERATG